MIHPRNDPLLIEAEEIAQRLHMDRHAVVACYRRRTWPITPIVKLAGGGIYFNRKKVESWMATGAMDYFGRKRTEEPHPHHTRNTP
jgi:hypothetical protein